MEQYISVKSILRNLSPHIGSEYEKLGMYVNNAVPIDRVWLV